MLFDISTKAKLINPVNNLPQVITALDAIFKLTENFADFVMDGG